MAAMSDRRARPPRAVASPGAARRAAELAKVLADAVAATPGWRFRATEEGYVDVSAAPVVLPDAQLLGTVERLVDLDEHDEDRARDAEPAVEALLTVYAALVDAEVALEAAEADAERARAEAVHDHLTGLLNRRGWEDALQQEQQRGGRRPSTAVVAVIDVDGLKATNDRGGHLAGDLLLKLAADTIAGSVRANDIVARIGGDEFAVLGLDYGEPLPGTFVERIQTALTGAGVSASVGAAVHRSGQRLLDDFDEADRAMYAVKRRRRDER